MCQLHRLDNPIDDHGGAQAGAQAQEEHFASLVASQGLHGGIIDDLDGTTKRGLKIESYPTSCQVVRLHNRPATAHDPWIAYRHHVILPVAVEFYDSCIHVFGSQGRPGRKFPRFLVSRGKDFHVGPTDIDDQDIHEATPILTVPRAAYRSMSQ